MKKKIFGVERIGLLPNYIVRKKNNIFVLQYSFCIAEKEDWRAKIVLQDGCSGLKLYCNTVYCIAGEGWEGWKDWIAIGWVGWQIVLQYSLGQPVSQDGRLCRDTAQVGARGAQQARRQLG